MGHEVPEDHRDEKAPERRDREHQTYRRANVLGADVTDPRRHR
jgi:hypothetical protein